MKKRLRVFLNYRREDTSGHAGRLYDALADRFGADNVFMDVDTIGPGSDFAAVIEKAVSRCDVLVALIGRHWLSAAGADGRRRLDDPADFVRVELESALASDLAVIPASVQGATLPDPAELPSSLQPLVRRQGIELRDTAWHDDINRLVRQLERLGARAGEEYGTTPPRRRRRPRPLLLVAVGLVALAAVAASVVLLTRGGGGGSTGGSAVNPRLLAAVPATVRATCQSIPWGDESATASADCSASRVTATYNLFPSRSVTDGWYIQKREAVGIAPGSGSCEPGSFRGEVTDPSGTYFCYLESGEPVLVWTQSGRNVGVKASADEGTGPATQASLLRQWRCCLRGEAS